MNDDVSMIEWMVESCDVSSIKLMKGFSGTLNSCRRSSITSHDVSEVKHKKGGDLHHPVCKQFYTTMLISSIYLVGAKDGSTYMKFHEYFLLTCRRPKPSLMLRSEKRNGRLVLYLSAKVDMRVFTHGPNCIIDYSGTCLVVTQFT